MYGNGGDNCFAPPGQAEKIRRCCYRDLAPPGPLVNGHCCLMQRNDTSNSIGVGRVLPFLSKQKKTVVAVTGIGPRWGRVLWALLLNIAQ